MRRRLNIKQKSGKNEELRDKMKIKKSGMGKMQKKQNVKQTYCRKYKI